MPISRLPAVLALSLASAFASSAFAEVRVNGPVEYGVFVSNYKDYQPGERVPSVRKLSTQLNVSHATVLQAYANLEDQGLIRARPQSGYYVHQTPALTAPTPDIARVERPGLVTRSSIIQQVLVESRREGVFPATW